MLRKALIIDDDVRFRDVVLPYLNSYDFEVLEAASIADGYKQLALARFDVLIIDGALPDGTGESVIKTVREQGNQAVIVYISGVFKDATTAERLKSNYNVALVKQKPIDPDEICREILEILRKKTMVTKRPTFTWERKAVDQLKTSQVMDRIQESGRTAEEEKPQENLEKAIEKVKSEYLADLPAMTADIREKLLFASHSPDRVDFDELILKVHNLRGTAGMHGQASLGLLMERIENFLKLFSECQDTGHESFESLLHELRLVESGIH